jgi:2-polyprenyl-6-hydroxyphenyl methylase/3-demethylubiquinone-9 3-methyltransferase
MHQSIQNGSQKDISGYRYGNSTLNHSHGYLLPALLDLLVSMNLAPEQHRIFELGCGNGSLADQLAQRGFDMTGVDPSEEGIAQANRTYPDLKLYQGSAYDDLTGRFGRFPVVISLEVVEHVYFPRKYAATLFDLVQPGGGGDYLNPLSWLSEKPGDGIGR